MLSEEYQELLTDNREGLVQSIQASELLWAGLIGEHVLTDDDKEDITVCIELSYKEF